MRVIKGLGLIVALIAFSAAPAGTAGAAEPVAGAAVYQSGAPVEAPYPSVFGTGGASGVSGSDDPSGDTFGAEPLVQDAANAYYLDDATASSFTFDGTPENGGNSVLYLASVTEMRVAEVFTPSASGGTVQVGVAAFDSLGALVDWVPSGSTAPGGETLIAWRLDVGSTAAIDPIDILSLNPGDTINVLNSGFTIYDLQGTPLGTYPLTIDTSDTTSVSGVALIGLGGADIAGFGLGSIEMFWEYEVIPVPVELQSFSIE